MDVKNGYFQLEIKPDGTYLRLIPANEKGKAVDFNELNDYLIDHGIFEYDMNSLIAAVNKGKTKTAEVRLTPVRISPVEETIKITLSQDRMLAVCCFYPASSEGARLTRGSIINELNKAGIKAGINMKIINTFLQKRVYNQQFIIAKGLQAVEGQDAILTYKFNTDNTLKPKVQEDGSVDFHQLDMISSVNKGDVLATLTPAVFGEPGMDIAGVRIQPKRVLQKILKHGKGIHLSQDGCTMYSDTDGHATLMDGKVFVSNTFEVLADVDASTGDIVYEGNVIVKGNVLTGYSIHAKGDIIVNGVVEGAKLFAQGQIILKRGMQGMSKGKMQAGSNIISKFIENAEVRAGGYISTEAILHSKVSAKREVILGGKKGFITGGEIQSGLMISAKTAGSTMGTATVLEVGIDPRVMDEYRTVQKSISQMERDLGKLLPIIETYKNKITAGEKIPQDRLEYIRLATNNCIALRNEIKELTKRSDELQIEMSEQTGGYIRIENIAYPGVKIVISNVNYYVRKETHYSKFIRDKADIKVVSL
ncbi:MAG: DUF342 domain-containing protein [Anaerocolumna sp.]